MAPPQTKSTNIQDVYANQTQDRKGSVKGLDKEMRFPRSQTVEIGTQC